MTEYLGRVLIIAGSDSGGGAGIQADIKTVAALGGYAMTAVTAVTVQNTMGVEAVHVVPADIVSGQIRVTLEDIGADVIKIGMLATEEIVEAVADALDAHSKGVPVVLDPVMVATAGARLIDDDAVAVLIERLAPMARLITPNIPEAALLTGMRVRTVADQVRAGDALRGMGARAALIKGGHLPGETISDVLVTPGDHRIFERQRIETPNTHGTGCTLASAIAAFLAQGADLDTAVERAGDYLHEAIRRAPGFGQGHGPVDHGWMSRNGSSGERG